MENYENDLFKAANKLRGKIPPSDYKFYVLPLVFLRYISVKKQNELWEELVANCESEEIARILDDRLTDALPKFYDFSNPFENIYEGSNLPLRTIKELICLIDGIDIGDDKNKIDYLGRIYGYFIGNFAATEGNRGGEFFTPPSVVDLMVRMIEPRKGIVYDPACGTGGMFIQSNKYSEAALTFIGQEQNCKTIMLAYMNGILHGLDLVIKNGDTLLNDCFPELKANYIISNPPFNMKDWGAEQLSLDDPRIIGMVNKNNANYMWIQHFVYHLKEDGMAGFVISNGALTSSNEADFKTRSKLLELNLVDCVLQLPDKMFIGTAIPSALIFINKCRKEKNKILFIDASMLGEAVNKSQKQFNTDDIDRLTKLYHDFKSHKEINYDEKGFSWAVEVEKVLSSDCKLMPSIYTGVREKKIDHKENVVQIEKLKLQLAEQIKASNKLGDELTKELVT